MKQGNHTPCRTSEPSLKFTTISNKVLPISLPNKVFSVFLGGLTVGSILLAGSQKSIRYSDSSIWVDYTVSKINKKPSETRKIIANLSESSKKTIALALIEKNPEILGSVIGDFEFKESNDLRWIASELRRKNPKILASCIGNFHGLNSLDLRYIASEYLINFQHEYLLSYLEHALMEDKDRIELAAEASEFSPELLNSCIESLKIEDEEIRYQLALHLTDRCPVALTPSIDRYKLSKPHLKKIAFLLLEKSPEVLAFHLPSYHLSEKDLKEIALAISNYQPKILIDSIEKFGIQDVKFINQTKKIALIKIDKLLKERDETSSKINELIKKRTQNKTEEHKRLLQNSRIAKSLTEISQYYPDLTIEEKVGIGQSIELRESLKNKYYIVNHGQNNNTIIINIVAKKAQELFEGKKDEHLEILRHETFFQELEKKSTEALDIHLLKHHLTRDSHLRNQNKSDHSFRTELIAGDIVFENTEIRESCLSFYSQEVNIAFKQGAFESNLFNPALKRALLKEILQPYFSDEKTVEKLLTKLEKVSPSNLEGGTLYSICVPKNKLFSIGYASSWGGRPYHKTLSQKDIDSFQNGRFTDGKDSYMFYKEDFTKDVYSYAKKAYYPVVHRGFHTASIPQIRLLTKKLSKEEGVFIIPHSTLSVEKMADMEKSVEDCLLEAKKRDHA